LILLRGVCHRPRQAGRCWHRLACTG
jgi:hypothetical protein